SIGYARPRQNIIKADWRGCRIHERELRRIGEANPVKLAAPRYGIDEDIRCPHANHGIYDDVTSLMDGSRALWHFECSRTMLPHEASSKRYKPFADGLAQARANHRETRQ